MKYFERLASHYFIAERCEYFVISVIFFVVYVKHTTE